MVSLAFLTGQISEKFGCCHKKNQMSDLLRRLINCWFPMSRESLLHPKVVSCCMFSYLGCLCFYSSSVVQEFLSEHDENHKHVETRNLKNGDVRRCRPISNIEIGDSITYALFLVTL